MSLAKKEKVADGRVKRVTLQDIDKVVGVHVMTVSDALNDTRSVAPATREKVKRIAKEMNYSPNLAARALVTGRTGVIAIVCGSMNEPYYANMVNAIEKHLHLDEYRVMLCRTPHQFKDIDSLRSILVDGAIIVDMYYMASEFNSRLHIPCVSIGTFQSPFFDYVIVDLSASVEEAVGMMVRAKRQRIAYLVTATYLGNAAEVRARAYLSVIAGTAQAPEIINVNTDVSTIVKSRFKTYIQENGCPDALLCQNDETAMCAYSVLRDCGYRIPEDVLLVGCDGQLHMEYFDPPLSTVVQPVEEMCVAAWRFLRHRMAQPDAPPQHATFQGKLEVRRSLMPPAS